MRNISITLIDPQIGFCHESGSLAREHGSDELSEIRRVIPRISSALIECRRRHLVKSEYSPGQFTKGALDLALSNLCVPSLSDDCHVLPEFLEKSYSSTSTKHKQSALSSAEYCREIDNDIALGIRCFVVSGFLMDHCVKRTAIDLSHRLKKHKSTVYVCSDLTAARKEKYANGAVSTAIESLLNQGIKYDSWHGIRD